MRFLSSYTCGYHKWIYLVCALPWLVTGLSDVTIKTNGEVEEGKAIRLECIFELSQEESLYSLSWYWTPAGEKRQPIQFYRYRPIDDANNQIHIWWKSFKRFFFIDLKESSPQSILLDRVSLKGEGLFSCEVSSLPTFDTRMGSAIVLVGRLPLSIPEIDSSHLASRKLSEGDMTSLNCSSFGSIPPPNITWFINGNRISEDPLLSSKLFLTQNKEIPFGWNSTSQLTFQLQSQILSPTSPLIKIKCLVTLYDLYYKSHEISIEIRRKKRLTTTNSSPRARPKKTLRTRTEPILGVSAHGNGGSRRKEIDLLCGLLILACSALSNWLTSQL